MAFDIKTWINRVTEFPGRRKLIPTGVTNEYDVERSEGAITSPGDSLSAETMNDLEERIAASIDVLDLHDILGLETAIEIEEEMIIGV